MNKKDVLNYYEARKVLSRDRAILDKKIQKLKKEYLRLNSILNHIEYVNLIDEVPVYLYNTWGGINVMSPFEESKRSAFLESIPKTRKYRIKLLKNENGHIIYDKILSRKQALSVAAHWINKGGVL